MRRLCLLFRWVRLIRLVGVMDGRTNKEIGDFVLPSYGRGLRLN
jgi:hypothetical protein